MTVDTPNRADGPPGAPTPTGECADEWARLARDERLVLMGLLAGAHARLTRVLGRELEEACGLPLTWYVGMVRISRAPDGRITMTELAQTLSLTSGGITRLVDRMTEEGLVERQGCPSDRRSVYVALTPAGYRQLASATDEHLAGLDRHLLGPLDADDRAALARALTKLGADRGACPG
ncbi:MAG: MarR family winged helix-turn-helix transcriptional regulator [Acidimicrobiales bacterium]